MTAELARRTGRLDLIRQQFAPNATDEQLGYFAQVARHLELDPWAGHICLVPYKGVHRPQITVAGRRFIAQRTGRLRGIDGPEWCGPRTPAGELVWRQVWDDDDAFPYAARCLVWPAEWIKPVNGTVKWSEFAQTDNKGDLTPTWKAMPSHMLGKVAESLALRRGFAEVAAAVDYIDDDDASLVAEAAAADAEPAAAAGPPLPPAAGSVPTGPPRNPGRGDRVPDWVYDQTPEAQGYR
jgi:phage recombination protein Bet